jgi:predicted ribosomally synthesized peptide with nif11-like leader
VGPERRIRSSCTEHLGEIVMSEEAAVAFANRLMSDEEFRDRLANADPEERRRMANEAGFDITVDDETAIRSALGLQEISDEDLELVAGGGDNTASIVLTVISGTAGAAAMAAIV